MNHFDCDVCSRRFPLAGDLEPFVCESCGDILCPLCEEDGCCRLLRRNDPPCSHCVEGMVPIAGDCMSCGGLGCFVENGLGRECRVCGGGGWLDVSLCERCGGYGYLVAARGLKKRPA